MEDLENALKKRGGKWSGRLSQALACVNAVRRRCGRNQLRHAQAQPCSLFSAEEVSGRQTDTAEAAGGRQTDTAEAAGGRQSDTAEAAGGLAGAGGRGMWVCLGG